MMNSVPLCSECSERARPKYLTCSVECARRRNIRLTNERRTQREDIERKAYGWTGLGGKIFTGRSFDVSHKYTAFHRHNFMVAPPPKAVKMINRFLVRLHTDPGCFELTSYGLVEVP